MQLATGQVRGRTVAELLDAGRLAGDRDDVIAMARLHRDGHGDPEPLHVEVGEPVIQHGRSEAGWKIFNRARHFRDLLHARAQLAAAERAAEQSRLDYGLVDGVTLPPRCGAAAVTTPDPVTFDDLCGDLPDHHSEVMDAHPSQPTPAAHVAAGATAPPGDIGDVADGTSAGSY